MDRTPFAIVRDPTSPDPRWWRFDRPREVLSIDRPERVLPAIEHVEREAERGRYAVGFLAYEAASAFDAAFTVRPDAPLPLLWFGVFDEPDPADPPTGDDETGTGLEWTSSIRPADHVEAVARVREAIADGSTYQVNLTYRLRTPFTGDPLALFAHLYRAQPTRYAAHLDTGRHVIASASPELFFSLSGDRVVSRPMKGTAARGRHIAEDDVHAARLGASEKERAENLMIVDMVRNDLGRIARPGSVVAPRLFAVERYATVLQMVSQIEARTDRSLAEIVSALFPAASITGAPKVSTMAWIHRLETEPRGIYTGAIGIVRPGRKADFSVAIRTAHIDKDRARIEYGTGGGVVWDSDADSEWSETRTKALILAPRPPRFDLFETLRWSADDGFYLLDLHLERLEASAGYFDFPIDAGHVQEVLESHVRGWSSTSPAQIVRLLVDEKGHIRLETQSLEPNVTDWRVGIAAHPIDSENRFLFHKTTLRTAYSAALATCPECDDALLYNERGEWTESTRANLVVVSGGVSYTPPVDCGLLAGTERAHRLRAGRLVERVLRDEDLWAANEIYLINSVRGRVDVDWSYLADEMKRMEASRGYDRRSNQRQRKDR